MFCVNSAYMVSGTPLKYLCAVLNSELITWFIKNSALNSGMGVPRWVKFTVERLPIPRLDAERQSLFVQLMDRILSKKAFSLDADVSEVEEDINRQVCRLYELTPKETEAIGRT